MKEMKVEISTRTILVALATVMALYIVWLIQDLLYSLFIAFILMSALRPVVQILKRHKAPHSLAVIMVYISFILFIVILFGIIIPPLTIETVSLIKNLPDIISSMGPLAEKWIREDSISQYVPSITNNIFSLAGSIFENILFIISTLFFGFYFLVEENILKKFIAKIFENGEQHITGRVVIKAEQRMSSWFWGELTLMLIIGLMTFVTLNLIGMSRYALPLAVLAGLLEAVPNIGPVISAVPALIIGLANSPVTGALAVSSYFIIQQLENNMIVPVVMKKTVGINPIITLIVLIIGGRLGGILGLFLSIPIYVVIETTIIEFLKEHRPADILR